MSRVQALTRLDKENESLVALREQAKELGGTTMFAATQVAEAQAFLAMAGIDADDIKLALPGLLDITAADGGLALSDTADIVSNILEALKIPADEMSDVSDAIVATFTRSNVNVQMIGETMKYVAGLGSNLNIDLETLAAATGLLGNVGVQGGQAGTALRSILSRLAAPEKAARDALEKLNIETVDSEGNLKNFLIILDELNEKTQTMGNAQRAEYIKAIAGTEAMTAMTQLLNASDKALGESGASSFTQFLEQIRNSQGEARNVAETMTDNLEGDITAIKSAWEAIGIDLYESQNTGLRELAQQFASILRKVNEWIKANPELAANLVKTAIAIAAIVTAGGALLVTVASFLGPIALLKYTFSSFFIKLGAGIGSIGKLGVVLKSLFLGLGITAVIAAVVAAVYLIYKHWDWIKEKTIAIWNTISDATVSAWESIVAFFKAIGASIASAFNAIWSTITGIWDRITGSTSETFTSIKNILVTAIGWYIDIFKRFNPVSVLMTIFDGVKSFFSGQASQFLEYGKNLATGLADGIKSGITAVRDAAVNMGSRVSDATKSFFKIRSPSRLFASFGEHLPEGLAMGIERNTKLVQRAAQAMAITAATASGGLSVAAQSEPILFDSRPSLIAMAADEKKRLASQSFTTAPAVTINVYSSPGQSAEEIARQVRDEIERLQYEQEARQRSSYSDYGR